MDSPRFIKLNVIHHAMKNLDTVLYIRHDTILEVMSATEADRNNRPEVNSIITTSGGRYAITQAAATVIEYIKEASPL